MVIAFSFLFLGAREWVVGVSPKNVRWTFVLPRAIQNRSVLNVWPWSISGLQLFVSCLM